MPHHGFCLHRSQVSLGICRRHRRRRRISLKRMSSKLRPSASGRPKVIFFPLIDDGVNKENIDETATPPYTPLEASLKVPSLKIRTAGSHSILKDGDGATADHDLHKTVRKDIDGKVRDSIKQKYVYPAIVELTEWQKKRRQYWRPPSMKNSNSVLR